MRRAPKYHRRFSRRDLLLRAATALPLLGGVGCTARRYGGAPFDTYKHLRQPRSTSGSMTATFFGTSSLLFQAGGTNVISDGFVSRPDRKAVLTGEIEPKEECIKWAMARLGIDRAAAIFAGHSHYDHAMDAPLFARLTGATLVGSDSTLNIGRGLAPPLPPMRQVADGETVSCQGIDLTFVESVHSRGDLASGRVDRPFDTPAPARMWRTGTTWSVFVRHAGKTLLVHGSANFKRRALRDRRASVAYLGIGSLGRRSQRFVDEYWDEVVRQTGTRRVILVHWDNFFLGLDEPLQPMPLPFDDIPEAIQKIMCAAGGREEVLLPVEWQPTDPFSGVD